MMKMTIKRLMNKISKGPFCPLFFWLWKGLNCIFVGILELTWYITSAPKPSLEEQLMVSENVTFIYKSFERQHMAKRLYRNIQKYYPGARVIIADDSRKPLNLQGLGLQVIQLPFNGGLSRGLNAALSQVQTPFVIRMDDDELLTPYSNFHGQVKFLMEHSEIDLVGILYWNIPRQLRWEKNAANYDRFDMREAPKELLIPHRTRIDETHVVLGKVPNIFIVRSEKYKDVGYDDNIRMLDHHEFFYRAAGNMVATLDNSCYVLHYHNPFHRTYEHYRKQIQEDLKYIRVKRELMKRNNLDKQ